MEGRLKATGGILFHLAMILTASMALDGLHGFGPVLLLPAPLRDLLMALIAANASMVLAPRSDFRMILSGRGSLLFCGNFGFIAAPEVPAQDDLLSASAIERFQRMGWETELRGAQAGGGLVMTRDRVGQTRFVGHRMVNAKRGDLTSALEAGSRRQRRRARRAGFRPHPSSLMASWHYRFGTSGPPAVRETHWQEWSPAQRRLLWTLDEGGWRCDRRIVHHRITHNGDFEAFRIFGADIDVVSLGRWLESALGQDAPAVVDSARIAGQMDLLICRGDWFAAVRWAFLATLADAPEPPSAALLEHWARHLEMAFVEQLRDQDGQPVLPDGAWARRLMERILPALAEGPLLRSHGRDGLRRWIHTAIDAFLHQDHQRAVRQFMDRARGSFGLVVVSTTWADRLVLSSLG
jgi:hypothetical protein